MTGRTKYGNQTYSGEMTLTVEDDNDVELMSELLDVPLVYVSSDQWDEKPFIFTE